MPARIEVGVFIWEGVASKPSTQAEGRSQDPSFLPRRGFKFSTLAGNSP